VDENTYWRTTSVPRSEAVMLAAAATSAEQPQITRKTASHVFSCSTKVLLVKHTPHTLPIFVYMFAINVRTHDRSHWLPLHT